MARFVISYTKDTDRSDAHWTGFPTWQMVADDAEAMVAIIEVPDHTLPKNPDDPDQLAAYWQVYYPWYADKLVKVLPPRG
jgi:hypothetical protein